MKRKVEVTKEQMVEAVKVNGKEPWNVVGIGRSSWFRGLQKNRTTMKELQSQSQSQSIDTSADGVTNEPNTVGRGGVRYRYTDMETERSDKMTTKEISVLENEVTLMGKTFNVYGTMEEPLFRAKDVADWIEHSNVSAMVQSVDEDEKLTINIAYSESQRHNEVFLTENGVYEVLMLSRKPVAKDFKKEVKKMLHALRTRKATIMPTNFADALEAYAKEVRAREEAQQALFTETQQKLLALEQKQAAEKETERIYQVNKNFHNNLYTASQVGKKLGITANMVGRIANEHGLKQDPIYGKLGKIRLNNGQWVNQFYYNDDALTVMEAVIG